MLKPKKDKKKHRAPPSLDAASIHKHITVRDLRNLVVWLLLDSEIVKPPKFLQVTNKLGIERVVSIMIPGLRRDLFLDDSSLNDPSPRSFESAELPILSKEFSAVWPTLAPGSKQRLESALGDFTTMPLNRAEKKEAENEQKREEAEAAAASFPLDKLLLSQEFLDTYDYPVTPKDDNWVVTKDIDRDPKVFALDCEMCDTVDGKKALTRISVVDFEEQVVFTSFVQPDVAISNYLTSFSGVTAELLEGVTTTRKDVQAWILRNVSKKDILIGHSIDNDMKALQLAHSRIIDTALCFTHPRGLPFRPSLKSLASRLLGTEIQAAEDGHDPAEDARTCIQLVKLKQRRGPSFGMHIYNQSLATRLSAGNRSSAVVVFGRWRWNSRDAASIVSCESDSEVLKQAIKLSKSHDFVFAVLGELDQCIAQHGADLKKAYTVLNENLTQFLKDLPDKSALTIWSGHGDTKEMLEMQQRQRKWLSEYRTKSYEEISDPWTDSDNLRLSNATINARLGVSFLKIKSENHEAPKKPASPANEGSDEYPMFQTAKKARVE